MAGRSVSLAGFTVSVQVPDRVSRLVRKTTGRVHKATGRVRHRVGRGRPPAGGAGNYLSPDGESQLIVRRPPHPDIARRDLEAGIGWIASRVERRRATEGSGSAEAARDGGDGSGVGAEELALGIATNPWYHTIEFPSGVVAKGVYDHRTLVDKYGLPDDLHGQTALDVGSADGFWALELERRGAKVTALDVESTAEIDLPFDLARLARARGYADPLGTGFTLAQRALASSLRRVSESVYDIDPDQLGTFDVVHAGDLLLHLRNPTKALEQIRSVTSGQALISDVFEPELGWPERPESGLVRYFGGWSSATWFVPSFGTLVQMVADAGFGSVEVVTVYCLYPRGESSGPWRVVVRARP